MAKKRIIVLGSIGETDRQNRDNMRVISGGYDVFSQSTYSTRQTVGVEEMEKKTIIIGRLLPETSDKIHQNQEIYFRVGEAPTIKSTAYKDPPKVLRKWKRK